MWLFATLEIFMNRGEFVGNIPLLQDVTVYHIMGENS